MKLELKKAFKNKFFWISVVLGCLITLLSFEHMVNMYYEGMSAISGNSTDIIYDPHIGINTVFNCWIGGEPFSLGSSIYFFVFPLLIALPYGWSYSEERKCGYRRMMITKTGKKKYYCAKYVAVFLSGGVAMVLPLIFNFWMTLLVVPAILPDVTMNMFYGVFGGSFLAELYYTVPFLYVAIYLFIDFVYCGFLVCICMAVSGIVRQKWGVVLIPFLLLLFVHVITDYIYSDPSVAYKELSPLYFLRGVEVRYSFSGSIILLFAIGLLVISLIGIIKEYRNEIY
ncbi:hypothetical protein [Coprococcus phoceensis]|uniref:hypothetical protein n=1 Tax=Coprococcus phoceensis TaxID=1870993 RepID=UPI003993A81B